MGEDEAGPERPAPDDAVAGPAPDAAPTLEPEPAARRMVHPLAWFWIYTGLRVVLYGIIFALLWAFGLGGLFGAFVALVLTVPLSYVVLARPRAAMIASINLLREQRVARTDALDEKLQAPTPEPSRNRPKNRP